MCLFTLNFAYRDQQMFPRALIAYCDRSSTRTSHPFLKILEKCSVPCTTPINTCSCYPLLLQQPNPTENRILLPNMGKKLLTLHFPVLIEFQSVSESLWLINCFPPYISFSTYETMIFHYFHGKSLDELHPLFQPILTFIAKTRHATL